MLVGFKCPRNTDRAGKCTRFEECLKLDCVNCLPYPIRSAIVSTISERDRWLSPSTISMCLRKAKWQLTKDYFVPPMESYAAMRGTLIHKILETADDRGQNEIVVSREVEGTGTTLKGAIDRVYNGIIYDYKTMMDAGFNIFNRDPNAKEQHVIQANIYRWMLIPSVDIDDIKIIYMGLGNVAVTGEDLIFDKWGKETQFKLNPCPIYTEERVYDYVKTKIDIIERMDTPPADSSAGWLCTVCPFTEECHKTPETDEDPF